MWRGGQGRQFIFVDDAWLGGGWGGMGVSDSEKLRDEKSRESEWLMTQGLLPPHHCEGDRAGGGGEGMLSGPDCNPQPVPY